MTPTIYDKARKCPKAPNQKHSYVRKDGPVTSLAKACVHCGDPR